MIVDTIPREILATLPTPLVRADRLSEDVGHEIWFKRDDLTGLGLGGNKVRALEYLIGDALAVGADTIVTGGGPQSNWVLLAALAGTVRGLDVRLVYFGPHREPTGNLALVSTLAGVEFEFTADPVRASVDPALDAIATRLTAEGRRPYVIGRGGAGPVGAVGYLTAVSEIDHQLATLKVETPNVLLAAGSCGTMAGLVAGQAISETYRRIVGVSVHRPVDECRSRIGSIVDATLERVGSPDVHPVDWDVSGGQLDQDASTRLRVAEVARLAARTEGVFLDMEFAAPALSELIAIAPSLDGPILFIVSGGAPTLFAANGLP